MAQPPAVGQGEFKWNKQDICRNLLRATFLWIFCAGKGCKQPLWHCDNGPQIQGSRSSAPGPRRKPQPQRVLIYNFEYSVLSFVGQPIGQKLSFLLIILWLQLLVVTIGYEKVIYRYIFAILLTYCQIVAW